MKQQLLVTRNHPCSGSIALVLVLVLSLVAGTFAVSILRSAATQRRVEYERQSVVLLQSAIDAVQDAGLSAAPPIRLLVDEDKDVTILLEQAAVPGRPVTLRATLFRNKTVLQTLYR